jgi:site-specific DNA-methyltransferase (adenine-specific)/adenine-specific DNA-methyltransferase
MGIENKDGHDSVLSDAEVEAIVTRVRSGEPLDERYRSTLFHRTREADLSYSGKESRGAVLASAMAVPLQTQKRFGERENGWIDKLVFGDNLQVLKTLLEHKQRGLLRNSDGSPGARLVYIDPPFATKREFRGKKGQLAYRDKVEGTEFIEYLRKRLILIHELLSEDGSLYLHLDTNKVHYLKIVLDEIFGPQNFRSEIVWKRSSAHSDTKQGRAQHGRIHDTILWYTKSSQWVWNPQYTPYDQEYIDDFYRFVEDDTERRYRLGDLTAPGGAGKGNPRYELMGVTRYWRYSKKEMARLVDEGRVVQTGPGTVPAYKRYLDEMPGVSLQDIWTDVKPIGAQASEREGYPTQKPVELLDRIIESSSNEGDLVIDCFAGSGTTLVSAAQLGRRWVGVDCGKLAIYTAQRRLLGVAAEDRGVGTSFEICYAGLYDNELLEQLSFEDFQTFTLDLFDCRPATFDISGVAMAGKRKGDPVHVFPFHLVDADLDDGYVESLHERIGSRVDRAVYVVVPDARCDPGLFEDILTFGSTSYFLLRVPYSVIEALHDRSFQLLGQPSALDQVNDALESYGFDFIQLPEAALGVKERRDGLTITLKHFHRGGLDPDDIPDLKDKGRGDLAMILVDPAFDGSTFRLGEHLFGEDLASNKWKFSISRAAEGSVVMLVLIDVHGNELRQVIRPGATAPESVTVGSAV